MQKRILIIIVIIVMLGLAAGLTLFVLHKNKPTTNENGNTNTIKTVNANTNTLNLNKTLTEEERQRIEIVRLANIFTARYGTYKGALTTSNTQGFKDLVTNSLFTQIQKQVNDTLAATSTSTVSTMVLSTTIQSFTKSTGAVVTVSTLRQNSDSATNASHATTQTITLGFFYLDNAWKIQSAQWGTPLNAPSVNQ